MKCAEPWAANNGMIESHGKPTKGAGPWAANNGLAESQGDARSQLLRANRHDVTIKVKTD